MQQRSRGMGLIEIVIGSAIITTGILALIESYTIYVRYALANQKNVQASYLIEEGLEVMGFLRDESWNANLSVLVPGTPYYLAFAAGQWSITPTSQPYIDDAFLREITIADAERDAGGRIVDPPGSTVDSNVKRVTVTVSFTQGHATTTKSITTYLANLYND